MIGMVNLENNNLYISYIFLYTVLNYIIIHKYDDLQIRINLFYVFTI